MTRLTEDQLATVIHQLWADAIEWQDTYLDDTRKLDVKNAHRERLLKRKDEVIATLIATARREEKQDAEIKRLREALEKIADAPACGPDGQLYYEVQSEDGQVVCMHVDPLGWIGSAATTARLALEPTP